MRKVLAALALIPLVVAVADCGNAGKSTPTLSRKISQSQSAVTSASKTPKWAATELEVADPKEDEGDDMGIYRIGHAAGPSDRRAITVLVKRYYRAAAKGDAAIACSLLTASTAEWAYEEYSDGSSQSRGSKSCKVVALRLFRRYHAELIGTIKVAAVRVDGIEGYALLRSSKLKYAFTRARRRGRTWRLLELLGAKLP